MVLHKRSLTRTGEVEEEGQVNVTYENSMESVYVSLSGRATLVVDPQQIEKLWHEDHRVWFPKALKDPKLALLRIDVDKWAYWDSESSGMSEHCGQLKNAPAEVIPEHRDHERVDLSGVWVSQDVGNTKTRNDLP